MPLAEAGDGGRESIKKRVRRPGLLEQSAQEDLAIDDPCAFAVAGNLYRNGIRGRCPTCFSDFLIAGQKLITASF